MNSEKPKLSDRVRPDVEAAPWVVEAIKKLEAKLATHPTPDAVTGSADAERITVVSITGIIQAVAATDYDSLKAERDRLQKELAGLHSARSATAEQVEVVGYAGRNQLELHRLLPKYPGMKIKNEPGERYTEPLMTVAQHQCILAGVRQQRDKLAGLLRDISSSESRGLDWAKKIDAALAEIKP